MVKASSVDNKITFRNQKGLLKLVLSIFLSILFIVLAFKDFNISEIIKYIENTEKPWILISLLMIILSSLFRALRWKILLPDEYDLKFRQIFSYTMIGYAANNVFPARTGEMFRFMYISGREGHSSGGAIASVTLERFMDVLILLTLLYFSVIKLPLVSNQYREFIFLAGGILLVAAVSVIMTCIFRNKAENWLKILIYPFPENFKKSAISTFDSMINGFKNSLEAGSFFYVIVLTGLSWLTSLSGFISLMRAFSINGGFYEAAFVLSVTSFGIALPSAPGFIGTYHYACQQAMMLLGVSGQIALGYAIISHGLNYAYITITGAFCFMLNGKPKIINDDKLFKPGHQV